MTIAPELDGYRCSTVHPEGCKQFVRRQIAYVKGNGEPDGGPKNVLVLGASNGLGLAARITAAYGYGAKTVGVFFDRQGEAGRPGTPGWYNCAAFHEYAREDGLYARSINGDAYSDETKEQVIHLLKEEVGPVDLVIYSLAAPKRVHPRTGHTYRSVLKPMDGVFSELTYNPRTEEVERVSVEPATTEEVEATVAVMGGEDWALWINALKEENLLASAFKTTAFTYLGPDLTRGIYERGTIGEAKRDLDQAVAAINRQIAPLGGSACVSVLKAMVTTASAAIPMIPLYLAVLIKVMKENGEHEGCIEQIYGLFTQCLYGKGQGPVDDQGRFRMDGKEIRADTQEKVRAIWTQLSTENLHELTDIDSYWKDYLMLFGFGFSEVDYEKDVDLSVAIEGLVIGK